MKSLIHVKGDCSIGLPTEPSYPGNRWNRTVARFRSCIIALRRLRCPAGAHRQALEGKHANAVANRRPCEPAKIGCLCRSADTSCHFARDCLGFRRSCRSPSRNACCNLPCRHIGGGTKASRTQTQTRHSRDPSASVSRLPGTDPFRPLRHSFFAWQVRISRLFRSLWLTLADFSRPLIG